MGKNYRSPKLYALGPPDPSVKGVNPASYELRTESLIEYDIATKHGLEEAAGNLCVLTNRQPGKRYFLAAR